MTAQMIIGGVGAELGGGKFTNGAVTAAFGYLFNEAWEELVGRNAAFRAARQDAGIPSSSIPRVTYEPLYDYDKFGNKTYVYDKDGKIITTRNYEYETSRGKIVIREHSIGHIAQGKLLETGHFNVTNVDKTQIPGTRGHYHFQGKLDPMRFFWRGPSVPRGGGGNE